MVDPVGNYLFKLLVRLLALNILNMDKVPIPFKFLDGSIYYICGEKTVTSKTDWGR